MSESHEILPHQADEPSYDETIEHPVGMIGDDDARAGCGDLVELPPIEADVEAELAHGSGEESFSGVAREWFSR